MWASPPKSARGDNNRKLSSEQRDEIVRRYLTQLPDGTWCGATTIAHEFGVSHGTVYNILKKRGVGIRDNRAAMTNGKRCKPITSVPATPAPDCKCGCGLTTEWNQRKDRWNVYMAGHYRRDAPYKHRDWLEHEYVANERTLGDIGAECGVGKHAVVKQMKKFGIPRRDARASHVGRSTGSDNPAWKGGVTPERQRLYKTPEWKGLVSSVFRRDGGRCRRCGQDKADGRQIHAHHVRPFADAPSLRTDMANLITLCKPCHIWVHSRGNRNSHFIR